MSASERLLFNSRDWAEKSRKDWLQFFSQHRKLGYCIILVAQFDKMIDRQFRSLLEYEMLHRKVGNFGVVGWIFSLFFAGRGHVCITKYYPNGQKLGSNWFIARKRVFQAYDSFTMFEGDSAKVT